LVLAHLVVELVDPFDSVLGEHAVEERIEGTGVCLRGCVWATTTATKCAKASSSNV
jgi:hypothetical protein